jgi:hypothetical protein
MTEAAVTALRPPQQLASPAPVAGEASRKPRSKDPTNAARQRRHRAKRRAASLAPVGEAAPAAVAPIAVTAHVTAPRNGGADVTAYVAAAALATAAAWFSVNGMVVLFPGAPLSVIAMAVAMESAKLVTAGWLARRWRVTAWVWRLVLIALVAGLAVINAAGVFSQLVAAHIGQRGEAAAAVEVQDATLAARIEVQAKTVADLDTRVAQIDAAVAEATKRGKTSTALAAMEGQRRARAGLVDERKREAGALAALQTERATVAAKGRQIETEAAPIRYVAAVFGVADQETAIRWLIALMVLCCDPLAIALTAAAASSRQ